MSIEAQLIFWQWAAGILGFALVAWMGVVAVVMWHDRTPRPRYRRGGAA